jgi:hypothetical protein
VAGGSSHVGTQGFLGERPHRRAVREQRRLSVTGDRQIVGGAFEAELTELATDRGIDFAKDGSRQRECRGEVLSHSGFL